MPRYSPFVDSVLIHLPDLLLDLKAREVTLPGRVEEIRQASPAHLAGTETARDPALLPLVKAGLLYAVDALDDAHRLMQESGDVTASYWHGMLHRREGDFENARHWFRRTGPHPVFAELHRKGSELSSDIARQLDWDPYLFTGLCERAAFGEEHDFLVPLQKMEFEVLFDYTWRQAVRA